MRRIILSNKNTWKMAPKIPPPVIAIEMSPGVKSILSAVYNGNNVSNADKPNAKINVKMAGVIKAL
ncbi:hypothetical protein JPSP37_00950 [Staphylococcus pseudintermedius]